MKPYDHILFDLDDTLWDMRTNSKAALTMIYNEFDLKTIGVESVEKFIETYLPINEQYWVRHYHFNLDKEHIRIGRFRDTLAAFGIINQDIAAQISERYIALAKSQTALHPYSLEVLQYLKQKGYGLHILTNGHADVQHIKMKNSGIDSFFDHVFISEEVGFHKPELAFFQFVITKLLTLPEQCMMVGDNFNTDILGAKKAGIAQTFYNPYSKKRGYGITHEINSLKELMGIL